MIPVPEKIREEDPVMVISNEEAVPVNSKL